MKTMTLVACFLLAGCQPVLLGLAAGVPVFADALLEEYDENYVSEPIPLEPLNNGEETITD
jgi:hypothetical protein